MKNRIISLIWLMLLTANLFAGQVFYVTTSGRDSNDGKSWLQPFADVQKAIDAAAEVANDDSPSEVWIAAGTYKHGSAMSMKNNVAIYGGFAGNETSKDQCVSGNVTALDGDGKYRVFCNNYTEDNPLTNSAKLDNVVIQNGFDSKYTSGKGAGMYNLYANPEIINCIFRDNMLSNSDDMFTNNSLLGGGIYNEYSNPIITNCTFSDNKISYSGRAGASLFGGGMCNISSSPKVRNCIFIKNSINHALSEVSSGLYFCKGGGVYNQDSRPTLINCTFSENRIYTDTIFSILYFFGGGMSNENSDPTVINCTFNKNELIGSSCAGGGIYNGSSSPVVINCTFQGNYVYSKSNTQYSYSFGGGMHNGNSTSTVINCTFADNKVSSVYNISSCTGGGISNDGYLNNSKIINSIIWNNVSNEIYNSTTSKLTIDSCIIQNGKNGVYNSTVITDSIMMPPFLQTLSDNGGSVQTCAVGVGSSAIGAGKVVEGVETDARGVIRSTTAPTIGAYEFAPPTIIETSKSVLGTINQDVSISISAKSALGDDNVAYQWQILNANGEWINIEGATESTYTIENCQAEMDGNKYRCIVSNILDGANVVSEEIVLTVVPSVSQAELSANRITIVDGGYGRLEVSSDAFEPSYKWYYSANTGIDWVEIENSNSSVLEFKASSSMNRYQYKCVVTDGGGTSVESNKAVLIINSSAIVISQDIEDAMGFIGKETVLSVSATSSSSLGYQWQVSSDNGATWVDIKDATSSSLSLIPEDYELSGNLYRLKIDNGGGFIYSNVSTFTVFKNVEIREQPKDLII